MVPVYAFCYLISVICVYLRPVRDCHCLFYHLRHFTRLALGDLCVMPIWALSFLLNNIRHSVFYTLICGQF